MKTAISIPDDVYAQAERLARRKKKSRSEVYTEAVREYVARHDTEEITAAINRVEAELTEPPDEFVALAARRILERTEW